MRPTQFPRLWADRARIAGFKVSNTDDVEEVTNYLRAFRWTQEQLRDPKGLLISVRLFCEAHRRLLDGVRGAGKQPGELRQSQNWIGGTRPGNAVFVPPPPEHVSTLLADMERFIHDEATDLPPMVKVALIHAQFETIHPFLDGNGRIGRLLIAALFEHWGLLSEPLMYLSGYLKQHQAEYYRLFEMLPMMPRFTIERARQQLDTSFPTATAAVQVLEDLGIVTEMTGQKKNRSYSYQTYVELLSR